LSTGAGAAGAAALTRLLGPEGAAAAQEHAAARTLSGTLSIFDFGCFNSPPLQRDIVKAYEQLQPGVKIQIISSPSGMDNTTYTIAQFTAGTAPDIVAPAVGQQPWADLTRNWWYELTDWVNTPNPYDPQHRTFRQGLLPQYLEQLQLDNRFWSVAISGQDSMFYYNKDLFAKAGIMDVPQTWDAFTKAQDKLQKAGTVPIAMEVGDVTFGDPFPSIPAITESMTMPQTLHKMHPGAGIVTLDELVTAIENGTFSAQSAEFQETWLLLKAWSRYFQRGFAAGVTSYPSAAAKLFMEGKAAMYWAGSYFIPTMESTVGNHFAWDVFAFPQITPASSRFATPGHKNVGVWGAWGACPWGVSNVAKQRGHLDMALDFMFFLTTPKRSALFNKDSVYIPLTKGLNAVGTNPFETAKLAEYAKVMSQPCALSTAETALGPNLQLQRTKLLGAYLTDQMPLSQAMSQMQIALNNAARQARRYVAVAQRH
jgi:ABC-type glycerol-3-phosphate transport system substrate-binding protein